MTAQQSWSLAYLGRLYDSLPDTLLYITSTGTLVFGIGTQLIGTIILARHLGGDQFGYLMSITSTNLIALSVTGLGTEEIMLRRCVREPTLYRRLLGHSLILILGSGSLFTLFAVVVLNLIVHVEENVARNLEILSIFSFSNIILGRWIVLTEVIFIAKSKIMYANIVSAGFGVARTLTAAFACLIFGVDRLDTWALWYGGLHVVVALTCVAALWSYGGPQWGVLREEIWRGIHVAIPQLVTTLRQNVDRIVLTVVAPAAVVGAYSIASNLVRFSSITINSFSRLFYPKLVIAGMRGVTATFELAVRYLPIVILIGILNSVGLFIISPMLPWLFGNEFVTSVHYLMALCWLSSFIAIQNIAYDALGAAEKHTVRAVFFNTIGLAGVGLIAGLTYFYDTNGAIIGLFTSQISMGVAMWLILLLGARRAKRSIPFASL